MRKHLLVALLIIGAMSSAVFAKSNGVLAKGSRGGTVRLLQEWLAESGISDGRAIDGYFGPQTEAAVREFQLQAGLSIDGKVGPATWCALAQAALRKGKGPADALAGRGLATPLMSWETINRAWPRGSTGWIVDLEKRTAIKVVRNGGYWHADIEPATADDTAVFKSWYGRWSWARRAVIFKTDRIQCAASINGMPHGAAIVRNNGFGGHFCLHFLGSRIHHSGLMDPDHQRTLMRAAKYLSALPPEEPDEAPLGEEGEEANGEGGGKKGAQQDQAQP